MGTETYQVRNWNKDSQEKQRSIARAVAINNVFGNLTFDDKTKIFNSKELRENLLFLAKEIEEWLVRE